MTQPATDKQLGALHDKLAKSMIKALDDSTKAEEIVRNHTDENGNCDLEGDVLSFLTQIANTNPALLTACAKFLKDNDITCAMDESEGLSDLEKIIQGKQATRRKKIGNVIPIEA